MEQFPQSIAHRRRLYAAATAAAMPDTVQRVQIPRSLLMQALLESLDRVALNTLPHRLHPDIHPRRRAGTDVAYHRSLGVVVRHRLLAREVCLLDQTHELDVVDVVRLAAQPLASWIDGALFHHPALCLLHQILGQPFGQLASLHNEPRTPQFVVCCYLPAQYIHAHNVPGVWIGISEEEGSGAESKWCPDKS